MWAYEIDGIQYIENNKLCKIIHVCKHLRLFFTALNIEFIRRINFFIFIDYHLKILNIPYSHIILCPKEMIWIVFVLQVIDFVKY
jgi:hypothetical protein